MIYILFAMSQSPIRFDLSQEEKNLIKRNFPYTELEARIFTFGQSGLDYNFYKTMVDGLLRNSVETITQEYTNYIFPSSERNASYRKTVATLPIPSTMLIKKTRRSTPATSLLKSLACFELKFSESTEEPIIDERVIPQNSDMVRKVTRQKISVMREGYKYSYDCSVVQSTKDGRTDTSYEIELESPFEENLPEAMTLADVAIRGINFLIDLLYEPYHLPKNFMVPSRYATFKAISSVQTLTGNSREKVDFSFRNDPKNLKPDTLSRLDDFAMTNKLDGERKLIVSLEESFLWVFHPNGWKESKPSTCYLIPIPSELPPFIFDAEYYERRFYIFDVIHYGSKSPSLKQLIPHQERMSVISSQLETNLAKIKINKKVFYYDTLLHNLSAFIKQNDPEEWYEHNDGLIFTSKTGSYVTTVNLKYKFPSKMSIDFYLDYKGDKDQQHVFDLCVGRYDRSTAKTMIVPFAPDRVTQQLVTYYHYKLPVIVECVYDSYYKKWVVLRTRDDKEYPNAERTALDVYQDIKSPILFSALTRSLPIDSFRAVIEDRESTFLLETYLRNNKLISFSFDASPQRTIDAFVNHYGIRDPRFATDVYQILHQSYYSEDKDSAILHRISSKTNQTYLVYGIPAEAGFLRTLATPLLNSVSQKDGNVFDARTNHVQSLCRLEGLTAQTYQKPIREMIEQGDRSPNLFAVTRFPTFHQIIQSWYPTLARIAVMKGFSLEESSQWRKWFPRSLVDIYESEHARYEEIHASIPVFNKDPVYELYEKWNQKQYEMIFISAVPRSDTDELYLQPTSSQPPMESRNIRVLAAHLLQYQICSSVVLLVPSNYPTSKFVPLFHAEQHSLGEALLIKLTASKPLTLNSPVNVSMWSIPFVDEYVRLFRTVSSQTHVLIRIPKDVITESLTSLIMMYHMNPITLAPWRLIRYEKLDQQAKINGYYLVANYDNESNRLHRYVQYAKAQAPPKLVEQLIVEEPVVACAPVAQRVPQAPIAQRVPQASQVSQAPIAQRAVRNTMRKYHNEEKGRLIRRYCKDRRVLDLGAGYGGDLHKYTESNVSSIVLVEPSLENIESEEPQGLKKRLSTMTIRNRAHVIHTVGQDTATILQQEIIPYGRVQVASSFFSMTFLFESRKILRDFLQTVQVSLTEGGYFIGTMMEGEKAFRALTGVGQKRYGDVEIIKQYNDTDKVDTGMKLWINIDDTIVKNQNEYLSFFSILKDEMEALEFELVWKFDFHPELHYEEIEPENQEFSKLNIGFAFRKMPSRISAPIDIIPVGISKEFINLYGDEQVLVRTGVEPDGNCFYHAYWYNRSAAYRQSSPSKRLQMVQAFRKEFSEWVTFARYLDTSSITLLTDLRETLSRIISKEQMVAYDNVFDQAYFEKHSYDMTIYNTTLSQLPSIQPIVQTTLRKMHEQLKKEIATQGTWATQRHIVLLMIYHNVNIYIIDSISRRPVLLLFSSYKVSRAHSMAVMVINDRHYEPIGFMSHGYAKRMLKPFDANLVKLHHHLMEANIDK